MERRKETFDITKALRKETYVSPTGNKQTNYTFKCLECGEEFGKTAYYAKKCTGYCWKCAPKFTHVKLKDTRSEKECSSCLELKPMSDFRNKGNHKDNQCGKCKNLLASFGITHKDYKEMLQKQDGKCAICFSENNHSHQSGKVADLAVDHCHKTGKIRGLLCSQCNFGIGNLKDDVSIMENAIKYIKDHNEC